MSPLSLKKPNGNESQGFESTGDIAILSCACRQRICMVLQSRDLCSGAAKVIIGPH